MEEREESRLEVKKRMGIEEEGEGKDDWEENCKFSAYSLIHRFPLFFIFSQQLEFQISPNLIFPPPPYNYLLKTNFERLNITTIIPKNTFNTHPFTISFMCSLHRVADCLSKYSEILKYLATEDSP